jgi:hypothetical protein
VTAHRHYYPRPSRRSTLKTVYHAEYFAWAAMKARCYNPSHPGYARYGERGIRICDRWLESFDNFLADMGPRLSPEHSIDRIDNDGDYAPENCRWATRREQACNRSSNVRLEYAGESMVLKDWAARTGLHPMCISLRLHRGWPVERALTTPSQRRKGR